MDRFILQYWHVLKHMKRELLIILAMIVGFFVVDASMRFVDLMTPSVSGLFVMRLLSFWAYLFPILFVYSLYRGENNQSLYKAAAHPLPKHTILLIKYVIFVDAMILTAFILTVYYLLLILNIIPRQKTVGAAIVVPQLFIGGLVEFFRTPYIILSLVCTAWGGMHIINRFRPVLGLAILGGGYLVYTAARGAHVPLYHPRTGLEYFELFVWLGSGVLFCVTGVYLDKKYEEGEK